jgi:hypothetical protein
MAGMDDEPSDEDREAWSAELEHLRQEHRDLDAAIEALLHIGGMDALQVQRLKKRKLVLRDRMSYLGDQITPDISA